MTSERQARRVKETKTRIVNAMREFLVDSPSPDITVEEICTRADVARMTFYNHFEDIRQVQLELLSELLVYDFERRERMSREPSLLKKFVACNEIFWAEREPWGNYDNNLLRIGMKEYFQQTAMAADMLRDIRAMYFIDWFRHAVADTDFEPGISGEALAEFFIGVQTATAMGAAFQPGYDYQKNVFLFNQWFQRYLKRKGANGAVPT